MSDVQIDYLATLEALKQAGHEFIDADTAFPWFDESTVRNNTKKGLTVVAIVGAAGLIDIAATEWSKNVDWSADEERDASAERFSHYLMQLSGDLERNPDEVSLCQSPNGDVCMQAEAYKMTNSEGVLSFAVDTIRFEPGIEQQPADKPTEREAIVIEEAIGGIDSTQDRTEEFDANLIATIDEAAEAYVAEVPDTPQQETNGYTSGLVAGSGVVAALMYATASKAIRNRRAFFSRRKDAFHEYEKNHWNAGKDPDFMSFLRFMRSEAGLDYYHKNGGAVRKFETKSRLEHRSDEKKEFNERVSRIIKELMTNKALKV